MHVRVHGCGVVASQLKAEEKQSSQQTQPQGRVVQGEEVAATGAQVGKAPAAKSASEEDADDDEEEGTTLSDKLEMFIMYMLIAGVVGGLGILIYRVSSGGARPLTARSVASLLGVCRRLVSRHTPPLREGVTPSRNATRTVLSAHGVGRRRAQRQPWTEAQRQRSATHQAGRHAFLQTAASPSP